MARPAALLDTQISIRPHFRRSISLERDGNRSAVDDYIPTARAIEVLRRLTDAMTQPVAVRAFSLTGPYGAGKSSFALFLSGLLGPSGDPIRSTAEARLRTFAGDVLADLDEARRTFDSDDSGFVRAVATADREPASITIGRALQRGVQERWGSGGPRALRRRVVDLANGASATGRDVADLVVDLNDHAPVLIVLDEFGKNLEYFADSPATGDIFLMQELAERLSGQGGRSLLVTLQHLAFDQYATSAPTEQRREWSKVQGRFNDISFIHDAEQSVRLIELSLDHTVASPRVRRDVRAWATQAFDLCDGLGLAPQLVPNAERVEACYPLNPVAALVIGELCGRFGQHERTLFSFLASGEPGSVATFLKEQRSTPGSLPSLSVDGAWDYFLESAGTSVRNSPDAPRWLEIDSRVRELHGLDDIAVRCAKAVGLLNLVSRGGALRASPGVIALGLGLVDDDGRKVVEAALSRLEAAGVVTYRTFADEYRVWEGTDFDIRGALEVSRTRLEDMSTADLLQQVGPLRPVVAARHSQRVGMLRYFEVRFLDEATPVPTAPADVDGLIAIRLGDPARPVGEASAVDARPTIVINVGPVGSLRDAALDAAAVLAVLDGDDLVDDRVARRELQERASVVLQRLRQQLDALLAAHTTGMLIGHGEVAAGTLSRLCSDVCDLVYPEAPQVRNEMLGRRELSSQGAKARRELLAGMVNRGGLPGLAIEHFGPERAMYEAALRHTGIHRETELGWGFGPPSVESSWLPAWQAAEKTLRDHGDKGIALDVIYERLMAPPFGLKDGPIPVLLTALLLAYRDEVALYQEGSYQPELTDDLLERLVKAPSRFSVKAIAVRGMRREVVEQLGVALGAVPPPPRRRNPTVIRVVAPLLATVRTLPEYTRRTSDLSGDTLAVRAALADARDPAELLFNALPTACGRQPVRASAKADSSEATGLVEDLLAAVEELTGAYDRMLEDSASAVASAFGLPEDLAELRTDLRARSRPLDGKVIDPSLRSFVMAAVDPALDDREWLEVLLLNVSAAVPAAWRDEDTGRFAVRLAEVAGAFRRVEALHYDSVAAERAGFDARRVTITAPTGQEVSSVYWVDHAILDVVQGAAQAALDQLEPVLGSRSLPALIAQLAGRAIVEEGTLWAADEAAPGSATVDEGEVADDR